MQGRETSPLGQASKTAQLNEGDVTPEAAKLNRFIDEYLSKQAALGREVPIPPTANDVNAILAGFCDDYDQRLKEGLEEKELTTAEKRRLHLAFATLLDVRLMRQETEQVEKK